MAELTFISGPMFSGKTEELLRIANRYVIAGEHILMYKPKRDDRYGEGVIKTHNNKAMVAQEIKSLYSINTDLANRSLGNNPLPAAIFIDEVQFLDSSDIDVFLTEVVDKCKVNVYCCGLLLDSYRIPFQTSEKLLVHATKIKMCTAVCNRCGCFDAIYTYRKPEAGSSDQVLIGGSDMYQALCADCYQATAT